MPTATQPGHIPVRKAQLPKGTISLETGLRCFDFTDRAGRVIPVHYYVSGDFTVGELDLGQSSSGGDEDDANEEVAEGENDSVAGDDDGTDDGIDHHLENDEDDFEDDFFREFEEHAELMLSQTVLFVCHGVLRNAQSYCKNWISCVLVTGTARSSLHRRSDACESACCTQAGGAVQSDGHLP